MSRPGYTLVEVVVGSVSAAMVLGGSVAALSFASGALEESAIAPARQRAAAESGMMILSDSRHARRVNRIDERTFEVTLDGTRAGSNAELARYAWSGGIGDPISMDLGTIMGRLGRQTRLESAERTTLFDGANTIDEREITAARAGIGVNTLRISTRTRSGTPNGYSKEKGSRFTITLRFNSSGVSPTGGPPSPVPPGATYTRIELRMTSPDDRFMHPEVRSANLPEPYTVSAHGGRIVVVELDRPAAQAGEIDVGMEVIDGWSFDYTITGLIFEDADEIDDYGDDDDDDDDTTPTSVSATLSGWRDSSPLMKPQPLDNGQNLIDGAINLLGGGLD